MHASINTHILDTVHTLKLMYTHTCTQRCGKNMLTYTLMLIHKGMACTVSVTMAGMPPQAHVHTDTYTGTIHTCRPRLTLHLCTHTCWHPSMPESFVHNGWPGTSTHRLSGQAEPDRCPTCPQGLIPRREGCRLIIPQCIPGRDKQPQASPARSSLDVSPLWIPPTRSAVLGLHRSRRQDTDVLARACHKSSWLLSHQGP